MSKITNFTNVFSGLSLSEEQTAKEEWSLVGEALVRKSHCLEDDMAIAQSLERVRLKHSHTSHLYQEYLRWLGSVSPAWQDKQYRQRIKQAYDGYKVIQSCGTPEQTTTSISKYKSNLALAEAGKCKDPHALAQALQRRSTPITAAEQKQFNKTGSFKVEVTNSLPQTENNVLTEDDKVMLLNLYIDKRCEEFNELLRVLLLKLEVSGICRGLEPLPHILL